MTHPLHLADRIARSPSRHLLAALLAWTAGIIAASLGVFPGPSSAAYLAPFLLVLALTRPTARKLLPLTLLALTLAAFGAAHFVRTERALGPFPATSYTGTASSDPSYGPRGISLRLERIRDGQGRKLTVHAFTLRLERPSLTAGDRVEWTCQDQPFVAGTFASCTAAHFKKGPPASGLDAWAFSLRRRIRDAARAALPEPDSSLLLGLVVGEREGIPPDISATYRDAGVSHVLSASGSNVGWVVLVASHALAVGLIRRRNALSRLMLAVIGFAILVGGDPPVVRAALVALTALIGEALGRKNDGTIALASAAALMLAMDPLLARDSVAFRLSFAAIIGLHAFTRPFQKKFTLVPASLGLRRVIAETSAASIATLPVVLHDFGRFPTATLIANAVLVPCIPALVGIGALAIAAAYLWAPLSLPFAVAFSLGSRTLNAIVAAIVRALPAFDLRIGSLTALLCVAALIVLRAFLHSTAEEDPDDGSYA